MSQIQFPIDPILPAQTDQIAKLRANRRNMLRGLAGLGLAAAALTPVGLVGAQDHGEHGPATPPVSDYLGSDASTEGTGDATPPPLPPEADHIPYDPYLKSVEPGDKSFDITCEDKTIWVAKDVAYAGWTFNGTIPGPVLRAVEGDTIYMRVTNASALAHNLDTHAARVSPEAGYKIVQPGESFEWSFRPRYPGTYMYHCGTAPVLMHIGAGMYGAMIIDPKEGWSPAQEIVMVQSEYYFEHTADSKAVRFPDMAKMMGSGFMDYVTFNGHANQYVESPIRIRVGEPVRIFFINCGPNIWSSFHVVGAVFDRAYVNGNPNNQLVGLQGVTVGPGDGAVVEFTVDEPGRYIAVNHAFGHAAHGAQAILQAE